MSSSIAGSIYYSGLSGSGTDWTQTLEQLKQIESIQLNRLQAWQDDWNLRYQAFGKIIEAAQSTKSQIATLKNRNNFVSKLVTSSDDGVVTGTANSNAQNMQHTINVKQVASNSVWANKHVFSSKNDIINKTDNAVDFKFTYGGKTVSISVPPNTTLDSFVSLVNNSKDNPGITVSTVKTSGGYLFQVAGKDTGEENNLVIYDCALEGMSAAGTSSSWSTSKEVNLGEVLTDPSDFVFDLVYDNGTKKSISIKGNSSLNDLVDAINSQTGRKIASLDPSGNLKLDGVQSFKRRESSEDADVPPSVKVYAGTKEDMSKPLVEGGTGSLSAELRMPPDLPERFEAGTPDIAGAFGFSAAIDYLRKLDIPAAREHEHRLLDQLTKRLSDIKNLKIFGAAKDKVCVVSFSVAGVHPNDISVLLNASGIAIRTGHHCAEPLMGTLGVDATARASLAFYNTAEEVDFFADKLERAVAMLA